MVTFLWCISLLVATLQQSYGSNKVSEDEKVVKGTTPKTKASTNLQKEIEKELKEEKAESSEHPSINDLVRRDQKYSE